MISKNINYDCGYYFDIKKNINFENYIYLI